MTKGKPQSVKANKETILSFLLAATLLVVFGIRSRMDVQTRDPESVLWSLFEAEREGNAKKFLAHFSSPLADQIREQYGQEWRKRLGRHLRERTAAIKGVSLTKPMAQTSPDTVRARVEFVFQDFNEEQFFHLEKTGHTWLIYRMEEARRFQPPVPYGTPVETIAPGRPEEQPQALRP